LLTLPSLQLSFYEVDLESQRNSVANLEWMVERLRGLKAPDAQLKMNQVEYLRDQARLLDEGCRKLENQKYFLKNKVEMLGQVANLVYLFTLVMSIEEREVFRGNVERLGAVSKMMYDMTKTLAQE
jgi:hypothetical protein